MEALTLVGIIFVIIGLSLLVLLLLALKYPKSFRWLVTNHPKDVILGKNQIFDCRHNNKKQYISIVKYDGIDNCVTELLCMECIEKKIKSGTIIIF